jgi:hypothetical protein
MVISNVKKFVVGYTRPVALFRWRVGDETTGENWGLTMVMAGDGGVSLHRYLGEGITDVIFLLLILLRGETLDLGLPDGTMVARSASLSLMRASFWCSCWMVEVGGGVVCTYRVKEVGSWSRGAAGSWWQTWLVGLVQGGDTIWRHGGVDGRPVRGFALFLHPGDGLVGLW